MEDQIAAALCQGRNAELKDVLQYMRKRIDDPARGYLYSQRRALNELVTELEAKEHRR